MKKKIIVWIFVASITIVVSGSIVWLLANSVNMSFAKNAVLCFCYKEESNPIELTDLEVKQIKAVFHGKIMYRDNMSCGFTEDICVRFNNMETFCFAQDGCPVVYWKEKNRYIRFSEEEQKQLYSLLELHGLFFPCL